MKTIKEVIINDLKAKQVKASDLYSSVRRGVKASIESWQFAQMNPDLSGELLQVAYNAEVEMRCERIMQVVLEEIYL